MPENRGNMPKALWPGVKAWWGADYKKHPEECKMVFETQSSEQAFEEDVELTGLGLVPEKSEGGSTVYGAIGQGPTPRYTHATMSLGFIVTEEEFDDNLYEKVASSRTKALAFSFRTTKEIIGANVLNRAFNSSYAGGDGKELCATDHPVADGSTQSNELGTPADISEAAVEDLLVQIANAKNTVGHQIALRPKRLIVPPALKFEATRSTRSVLRSGTDIHDIHAMREMGFFQEDPMVNHNLTDEDGWFITTDAPDGLKMYQRKTRVIRRENEFDTDNLKVKGVERYSFGHTDWRGVFGTPGAA